MLSRILDWIDEAAGGMIRLAYLLAGIVAVAVYFGAGHLPAAVENALNAALPWALAFAIETHTYITARRVRAAWQDMQSAERKGPEWMRARDAMRVNISILAALLTFSCWNQLNYLFETWTPPTMAFGLPLWVAYVVRALIVPAAFLCAAFLAPMAPPIAAQVEAEARDTLSAVFGVARKQRRNMVKEALKSGRDMTGALVELVEDPIARNIIGRAYAAIRPPTGGGTPTAAKPQGLRKSGTSGATGRLVLRVASGPALRKPHTATTAGERRVGASVEPVARRAWEAGARSKPAMIAHAKANGDTISGASAAKYIERFMAEGDGEQQQAAAI